MKTLKRIILLANSFPSEIHPNNGIFNVNTIKALRKYFDVSVMVVRTWRPYRRLSKYRFADVEIKYIDLPVIPFEHPAMPVSLNHVMYKYSIVYALKLFRPQSLGVGNLKDFFLIHSVSGTLGAYVADKIAQHVNIFHVTQLIGIDVDYEMPIMCEIPGIRKIYSNVSGVVANSQYLADKYLEYIPETSNIRVIYRGTDLQRFHPSNDAENSRKQNKGVTFLYLGGFGYNHKGSTSNMKGGDTILAVWKKNEDELRNLNARIIIGGPNTPNEYLEGWRKHLKYSDAVKIIGVVNNNEMPHLLGTIDAVLIPSLKEGLPNLGMEAFACGKTVIGSKVGGIPELIRNDVDGMLVSANDIEAWGKILTKSAASKEKLYGYGLAARKRAEMIFDSSKYGEKLYDFYKGCTITN